MKRRPEQTATAYSQQGWSLTDLLPDSGDQTLGRRLESLQAQVEAFEAVRPELAPGIQPQRLLEILRLYERLDEDMLELGAYASLWFAEDTQSEEALTFKNRVEHALTPLHNRVLFFSLWWKALEEEEAERLMKGLEGESDLHHFLADQRRFAPFALDEKSEQVIQLKDANGMGGVLTLYSMLTNRLEFRLDVDGEEKTLTRDALMSYVQSSRPDLREAAYKEMLRVFERESTVLAQAYVNRVRDWQSEKLQLRGFSSPIAVRNLGNDIPDAAVETLLEVTAENVHLFQRYFRLKAGWLGTDRLHRYDLYAPLATAERTVSYGEAVDLVLDTFRRFDPMFADQAEGVFAEDRIDSEIRRGKKGGAFCATVLPSQTPWVLINYAERVRDVATLAHELGHAVHSMMAGSHSVLTQQASLPLAETASVFAEMLLTERLLEEDDDPLWRRELLASALDDIYATVMRQAYFTRFETEAHRKIVAGASPKQLGDLFLETLRDQFGDSVELPHEFRYEWLAIPHIFFSPFYCYAYSFGQLLVLALFQRYRQQGQAFLPGYRRLLAHGGSERPERILAEAGVEMRDPEFWRGGFAVVADMVDRLDALGNELPAEG